MALPLSLYIHFPWCRRKCPYCDFNSYPLPYDTAASLFTTYGEHLLLDLANEARKLPQAELATIYFGGGTPSLFPPQMVARIISEVKNLFTLAADAEITLEANPGTLDLAACVAFKTAGIKRISLGVQSFQEHSLRHLGRIHTAEQTQAALSAIKEAGFTNFNLDLMFGLPAQKVASALADLQLALEFAPPHLSWYQLTIEPNTQFAVMPPPLPQLEELWEIQQQGIELLMQAGLAHYEVSAYSRVGYECRHNINYWQYGDYLGIGAGAHSKISSSNGVVQRYWKIATPNEYQQASPLFTSGVEKLGPQRRAFEFMFNALRLYRPITHRLFQERTGVTIDLIAEQLDRAAQLGLIELTETTIVTTPKGRDFLNDLLEIFL